MACRINILESLPCAIFLRPYEKSLLQMPALSDDAPVGAIIRTEAGEIYVNSTSHTHTL
jgi:hypothetical protein